MMRSVFLTILNVSVTATFLAIAAIAFRLIFRKSAKTLRLILWVMLALRLLIPVSIENPLSLVPSAETFSVRKTEPANAVEETGLTVEIRTGIDAVDSALSERRMTNKTDQMTPAPSTAVNVADSPETVLSTGRAFNTKTLLNVLAVIWIAGAAAMMAYFVIAEIRIQKLTRRAVHRSGNVYVLPKANGSFVYGWFRPRIYISDGLEPETERYVIAHEKTHIAYGDHIAKAVGFLILACYWFHPLLWVSYALFSRDIEYACDERVIRGISTDERADYATALLRFGEDRRFPMTAHFAEADKKSRIKAILNYKKPTIWVIIGSVLLIAAVGVTLMTVQKTKDRYTVDVPYAYPVTPGMEEWKTMELSEKREACKVPDGLARKMTTKALTETVLTYPFIIEFSAMLDSTISVNGQNEKIDRMRVSFEPLDVLLDRENAVAELNAYVDALPESSASSSEATVRTMMAHAFIEYISEKSNLTAIERVTARYPKLLSMDVSNGVTVTVIAYSTTTFRCVIHPSDRMVFIDSDQIIKIMVSEEEAFAEAEYVSLDDANTLLSALEVKPRDVRIEIMPLNENCVPVRSIVREAFDSKYTIQRSLVYFRQEE